MGARLALYRSNLEDLRAVVTIYDVPGRARGRWPSCISLELYRLLELGVIINI
jgi:hypothetical protein